MKGVQFEYNCGAAVLKYKNSKKEQTFIYFLNKIVDSWIQINPDKIFEENDLGKLKILLLLFFTVASSVKIEDEGLLSVFDNFIAVPHGHIEGDIHDLIGYRKGRFGKWLITDKRIEIIK